MLLGVEVGGMLDPDARNVIEMLEEYGVEMSDMSTAEARNAMDMLSGMASGSGRDVASVEDTEIPVSGGLDARVYDPSEEETPVVVYFHGGGFVVGGLDTHDSLCRMLADESGCTVVSVDYRLAPEHPFPEPVMDAYYSVLWLRNNADEIPADVDVGSLGVAGDSAGGTLAAVVSLMSRDRGLPEIAHQSLFYPGVAYDSPMESRAEFSEGYFLSVDDIAWFYRRYFQHEFDPLHPYALPLQARSLNGVPSAHVVTAGYDPLRDEGQVYAERLESEGVDVTYRNYDGMIHGFLTMDAVIDRAREVVEDTGEVLRSRLC